jgi:hypothetical protein
MIASSFGTVVWNRGTMRAARDLITGESHRRYDNASNAIDGRNALLPDSCCE